MTGSTAPEPGLNVAGSPPSKGEEAPTARLGLEPPAGAAAADAEAEAPAAEAAEAEEAATGGGDAESLPE